MEWKKEMISLIIVANNKWGDFATPYIDSVIRHEIATEIILVDNGSPTPYQHSKDYHLIRLPEKEHYNYMQALNKGAKEAQGDWLIFSNDDVKCTGSFARKIKELPEIGLYGAEIRNKPENWGAGRDFCYIYGWIMVMHRAVYLAVGEFDEHYLHAGFDDIDYSWRSQQMDIPVMAVDLPFIHLADQPGHFHRRMTVEGYRDSMARSKAHFIEKVNGEA